MSAPNIIQWYESAQLDDPKLRSPSPCPRGVYCQYKLPNKETKELEIACCRMVHPGEEGNGRRLFPSRTAPDGREQPACVRLTGKALFYERCRLKLPWRVFAAQHGIPLPPADVPWIQVERGPILRNPPAMASTILETHGLERAATSAAATSAAATSAAATSAAATSAADWPALPYRTPGPPPRLNLSGSRTVSYGFSAADSLRLPPEIVRLRSERLYGDDEETGSVEECSIPPLYSSANSALCAEGAMEAVD